MTSPRITIGAEFGDALSGDFLPHEDQEYRLHRLARLARSGAKKGFLLGQFSSEQFAELASVGDERPSTLVFEYQPSWARVTCLTIAEDHYDRLCITGLRLHKPNNNHLAVYDLSDEFASRMMYVHNTDHVALPLDEQAEITHAQEELARTAQAFFNAS